MASTESSFVSSQSDDALDARHRLNDVVRRSRTLPVERTIRAAPLRDRRHSSGEIHRYLHDQRRRSLVRNMEALVERSFPSPSHRRDLCRSSRTFRAFCSKRSPSETSRRRRSGAPVLLGLHYTCRRRRRPCCCFEGRLLRSWVANFSGSSKEKKRRSS